MGIICALLVLNVARDLLRRMDAENTLTFGLDIIIVDVHSPELVLNAGLRPAKHIPVFILFAPIASNLSDSNSRFCEVLAGLVLHLIKFLLDFERVGMEGQGYGVGFWVNWDTENTKVAVSESGQCCRLLQPVEFCSSCCIL